MDAIQGAARAKLGNHPALIFLPEFILPHRGYGVIVREEMPRELRIELELEAEYPSIEEVEAALDDLDSSDLLDDIIDEYTQEMDDLLDEFEKEIEDLEETENELPDKIEEVDEYTEETEETNSDGDDDNNETNEGEDDGDTEGDKEEQKKCYSISLGIGDSKVTFNTCHEDDDDDSFFNEDTIEGCRYLTWSQTIDYTHSYYP